MKLVGSSPLTGFHRRMRSLAQERPDAFPDFSSSRALAIATDSSGEHRRSAYHVLGILIAELDTIRLWAEARDAVRRRHLSDGRRMSFKDLRDSRRRAALPAWLAAADQLSGIAITVAVDRDYGSMFEGPSPLNLDHPSFKPYAAWPAATLEKACRLCHFIGISLAALAYPGQDVIWCTDEDEIAANRTRLGELTNLFAWITSHYLPFSLGHARVGTTADDNESRLLEDLSSIPDLLAGSLSEVMQRKQDSDISLSSNITWPVPNATEKSFHILGWLGSPPKRLNRIACVVDSLGDESLTSFLKFSMGIGP